ncbi:hypothetical protein [Aquiflexum sp.]|uniref:hypothetical protein n=1 Tax=Aquiflexum sp. TaxID=1872584 RepID=UPI0035931507
MNKYLLILFFILSPILLQGQELFTGDYTFNGLKGEAAFEFVKGAEGTLIKQGYFRFLRKERDIEDKAVFYKTQVEGNYEQDKKTGLWDYTDERHQIEFKDVVDFKLISELSSQQIKLKANYLQGNPHGKWTFEQNEFAEGKLSKKSQAEDLQFFDGDIRGKFQYKSFVSGKTHFIRGELVGNGYMNGEWTFVYEEEGILINEVRNYENGFLLGLVKRDLEKDDVIDEVVFYETIRKLNQVNNIENKGFRVSEEKFGIQFNDGFLSGAPQFSAQRSGNQFITEFLTNVMRYDEKFVNQSGEVIDYPIHTKKFVFELTRNQQKIVEELPAKFDQLKTTVKDYSERNALMLNRQKSDTLSFAYAFFQFQNQKLKDFDEIMNLIITKEIQYYDLNHLVQDGKTILSETDEISFTFEEENLTREVTYTVGDFENNFYSVLSDYISQMNAKTMEFKSYVDGSLSKIERDEDLRNIQNQIQERRDQLDEKYLLAEDYSFETLELLQSIHDNILGTGFDRLNELYAKEENFDGKKETARKMLDLLNEMENQYQHLTELYSNFDKMDELYMEEVFNPFTYTRYDQRDKPRLYESAERVFEYYMIQLQKEEDYTQIKYWVEKIDSLFQRMSELKEADSRVVERKLNRRLSINRVEAILEL